MARKMHDWVFYLDGPVHYLNNTTEAVALKEALRLSRQYGRACEVAELETWARSTMRDAMLFSVKASY